MRGRRASSLIENGHSVSGSCFAQLIQLVFSIYCPYEQKLTEPGGSFLKPAGGAS
jgi:hypothetical protein